MYRERSGRKRLPIRVVSFTRRAAPNKLAGSVSPSKVLDLALSSMRASWSSKIHDARRCPARPRVRGQRVSLRAVDVLLLTSVSPRAGWFLAVAEMKRVRVPHHRNGSVYRASKM